MPDTGDVNFVAMAQTNLGEAALPSGLSDASQEAYRDAAGLVGDVLNVASTAEDDLAELVTKRDLTPAAGYKRLLGEITGQAEAHATEAERHFNRSLESLKTALIDDAFPQVDRSREALDREELRIGVGAVEGERLVARLMSIAKSGSYGATSIVGSPFVRTLMSARGVENIDDRIATLKLIASQRQFAEASPREKAAQEALAKIGKLQGAFTASRAAVRHTLRPYKP